MTYKTVYHLAMVHGLGSVCYLLNEWRKFDIDGHAAFSGIRSTI